MVAPADCGSLYYNYKQTHKHCFDANYTQIYVDIGCKNLDTQGMKIGIGRCFKIIRNFMICTVDLI